MDGNILITAFITLPIAEAIIGKEVSGLIAFSREEIKIRLKALNGQSVGYKVAELEYYVASVTKLLQQYIINKTI